MRRVGRTQTKQRDFMELVYGARTWKSTRRCVARLEFGSQGANLRFVVTNIQPAERDASALYDQRYCQHGEAPEPHQGGATGVI